MYSDPLLVDLESVPVRIVWPHEAQSFTPWLAANLDRLSEAIGVPLCATDGKAIAGTQIADLLARDERDGSTVVIENQLEAGDNAHLGQILTYLAGVDARTVVWIAERFSDPHLSAIRWLNANTRPAFSFYAVRIRVVRIEGSALAPVFDALERPNGWERALRVSTHEAAAGVGSFAAGFWAAHLARYPDEARLSRPVGERCRWRATKPAGVVIGQLVQENSACVFLRGRNGVTLDAVQEALAPFADRLEARLGVSLQGERPALLAEKSLAIDASKPSNWIEASDWLRTHAQAYDLALREVVRENARR